MALQSARPGLVQELLGEIAHAESTIPLFAIESLIAIGGSAVHPLVELLQEIEPDEDDWTPLWITVALGELRAPEATPALLSLLALPDGDVLSEAAVEAIAKIGAPALPELGRFARESSQWEARHYAYSALGLIPSGESRQILTEALATDVLLWNSLAIALADQGDPAALPALKRIMGQCDARESPAVREAIDILEKKHPPHPRPHEKDWRTRYAGLLAS